MSTHISPLKDSKDSLISKLKNKINTTSKIASEELIELKNKEEELLTESKRSFSIDQEMAVQQLNINRRKLQAMETLLHSPFFAKITYRINNEDKSFYISKYELIEEDIISWTTPIANLRFESLGKNKVQLPNEELKDVELTQKDNYVINDEKIIYYSQENSSNGVEIIYEDFLSNIKTEFGLSEIIAKIEKEQYKIIQSKYNIPLIISGPAGSGKTTICLHRISYLLQTPETSDKYMNEGMLMLVQDKSTKDYFSSILPKLGINNMDVYTYFEWGCSVLNIEDEISETDLYNIEEKYFEFLQHKIEIINKNKIPRTRKFGSNILQDLDNIYKKNLDSEYYEIFKINKNKKVLDYLDITIMLSMMSLDGNLYREEITYKSLGGGKYKTKKNKRDIKYSLVMIDEFQNYSNDQISLIQQTVNPKNNSIVYIGDINQKSLLKPESILHQNLFQDCDKIVLDKVYRNTKNILQYIQSKGYKISIPEKSRQGENVKEIKINKPPELVDNINKIISETKDATLGILFDNVKLLNQIKSEIEVNSDYIKFMTKIESQGTEFNTVVSINSFNVGEFKDINYSDQFRDMKIAAQRNSNYIAYTRAVEKLIVLDLLN